MPPNLLNLIWYTVLGSVGGSLIVAGLQRCFKGLNPKPRPSGPGNWVIGVVLCVAGLGVCGYLVALLVADAVPPHQVADALTGSEGTLLDTDTVVLDNQVMLLALLPATRAGKVQRSRGGGAKQNKQGRGTD